ncbi:MAG: protein jag [Clostridia bacterium]|nr:protein jag [Clostridia bacterium]
MQFTAKTVEEATEQGLKELNISESDAIITVIEKPTKGLFGKIKGQAVVEITKKDSVVNNSIANDNGDDKETVFLAKVLELLGLNAKIEKSFKEEKEILTLISEDSSSVIGFRGEVLDALQTLAGAVANIGKDEYKKIVVDCENYRGKREETLISLAHRLEEKATEMKREVMLEPMTPFERRIIHNALLNSTTVTTRSDGKDPLRYVVIVPNEKDEFSKPYNAGRKRDGNRHDNKRHDGKKPMGKRQSGSSGERKRNSFTFGTYLGNSMKDKE